MLSLLNRSIVLNLQEINFTVKCPHNYTGNSQSFSQHRRSITVTAILDVYKRQAIYFPEYTDVFGDYEAQSSMLLLKKVCTPEAIVELGAEKINQIWRCLLYTS